MSVFGVWEIPWAVDFGALWLEMGILHELYTHEQCIIDRNAELCNWVSLRLLLPVHPHSPKRSALSVAFSSDPGTRVN